MNLLRKLFGGGQAKQENDGELGTVLRDIPGTAHARATIFCKAFPDAAQADAMIQIARNAVIPPFGGDDTIGRVMDVVYRQVAWTAGDLVGDATLAKINALVEGRYLRENTPAKIQLLVHKETQVVTYHAIIIRDMHGLDPDAMLQAINWAYAFAPH